MENLGYFAELKRNIIRLGDHLKKEEDMDKLWPFKGIGMVLKENDQFALVILKGQIGNHKHFNTSSGLIDFLIKNHPVKGRNNKISN